MSVESTIPSKKDAVKTFKSPSYRKAVVNFADDEELVKKVLSFAQTNKTFFESQAERNSFADICEKADRMVRCSRLRDEGDKQYDDVNSNVATTAMIQRFQTVTSNENSIYFPTTGDLPVENEAVEGVEDYQAEEGRRIAHHHNLLLQYTFERDNTEEKIKNSVFFLNKYSNQMYYSDWCFEQEEVRDRVPTRNQEGEITGFRWVEKKVTKKNHPTFRAVPWDNVWFDARIDNMQMQNAVIEWDSIDLNSLWSMQANGHYKHVETLSHSENVMGGDEETRELQKRQTNADEGTSIGDRSSLFDRFVCWVRVPVKVDGDKAEWSEEDTVPTWFRATFIGQLRGKPVCVELIENPFFHKELPYNHVHSHRDDKGAYHMGFPSMVESLYEELMTTINQAIDNKTLINRPPWLTQKGNIQSLDLVFGKNRVWYTRRAPTQDSIRQVDVKDATGTTMAMYNRTLEELDAAMNTGKAIVGEALGSRTSASEAKQVFDQAFKTLVDKASYQAEQLFPWMARMVASLWRQYADPKLTLAITTSDGVEEVKPAELWGPLNYKVTAIKKFDTDVTRRSEQNQFFQTWMQPLMESMGPDGTAELMARLMEERQIFDNPSSLFGRKTSADAERVAQSESETMYFDKIPDNPAEGEDHETHLRVHENYLNLIRTLPREQQDQDGIALLQEHIERTRQLQQQAQAPQGLPQGGPQGPAQQAAPPQLQGEAAGDQIGGLLGALNA